MNRRITGIFLIAVPIAFNVAFFALGSAFEYPDILRKPTDYILQQYVAGGTNLTALWYIFTMTALLAIPLALLLQGVFAEEHPQIAQASGVIGTLSGLVQAFGLLRWVFLVPVLTTLYTSATATPATRDAVVVVFEGAHQFLGVAIGEHLGYFFTGTWTILLSVMMFKSRTFHPVLGVIGIVAAIGIMAGLLEPAGWSSAGAVNALSYILWSVWLIILGVILLVRKAPLALSA